uniref:ADP-heptose synthase/D-glycero-beta-D-manno-heptose 7-phosphate kinase n=1 Tax=uncultured bacterium esnapd14 TaxID=1366594 RepID=S5TMT4_9BACT|nr:ADP-heptose synthase/D-glycero-beta-D-manno-heptose 7-phosphate kinase [uncultured bacterium esnapd14]
MTVDLARLLDDVAGVNVVVVGDALLDEFVTGTMRGLCREAPAPVIAVLGSTQAPGAAGNTAANVVALGGRVRLVCAAGQPLRDLLEAHGISAEYVLEGPTVVKKRIVAGGHILMRLDEGGPVEALPGLDERLADAVTGTGVLMISDYGYGVLGPGRMPALQRAYDRVDVTVVDAKEPERYRSLRPTAATPNYAEAVRLLGLPLLDRDDDRLAQLLSRGDDLLAATGARHVAVTLSGNGSVLFEPGRPPYRAVVTDPAPHDVVGAGDVFAAALALALGADAPAPIAAEFATQAATCASLASAGVTARCPRHLLAARLHAGDKVLAPADLAQWAQTMRANGMRIVFTNGCFDILHEGHVALLSQAKALGDRLIVAVNDDDSVHAIKGPGRPVIDLAGRMRMLAALSCVDHVVAFSGPTPGDLIEAVRPDLYVKGGDYRSRVLPELPVLQRLGVEMRLLDSLQERSTSRIIEHVRSHG